MKERFARRNLFDGLALAGADRITPPYVPATISTYLPSWRERIADAAGTLASRQFGAGNYARQDVEKKVGDILDWLPLAGTAVNGNETYRAAEQGDWAGAGIGVVGMAGSLLPFAGRAVKGIARKAERKAAEVLASNSPVLYPPPVTPARDFALDYPRGGVADETGKLKFDIEGRPLTAPLIVGRRTIGGPDVGLLPNEYEPLATAITGRPPKLVARREIGGDAGRYEVWRDRRSGRVQSREIFLDKKLVPEQRTLVLGHEVGHATDEIAGPISPKGLTRELGQVYSTLNTGQESPTRLLTLPQHLGYPAKRIPGELTAEAINAYLADPGYFKTVAPKTAARIRLYVNDNPRLKGIIQFNSLGAGAVGLSATTGRGQDRP